MASNKDPKTSKTAHVMNLLSKNRNTAPAEPDPAPAPAEPAAAAAPEAAAPAAAPMAPIIASINADAAVSSQIKDALEASLNPAEPAVQTPPPVPAPAPVPAAPAAPKPAAAEPELQPEPQPVPQPQEPVETAAPAAPRDAYEPPAYVNVMEVLVREKAEKYMRATGMCCCDHCTVDVMAYTLSHLPPKYVVMSKGEMIPKLTFYEVQHSSDITTQLMRACEIVSKSPHHGRE